jgi:hypothetical protein
MDSKVVWLKPKDEAPTVVVLDAETQAMLARIQNQYREDQRARLDW